MSSTDLVYLDHAATTPLDRRVLDAMLPFLEGTHGNPASSHAAGRDSLRCVERARRQVADLLAATPQEVLFTSGATEANNLALKGLASGAADDRRRIVSFVTEHPSVLQPLSTLAEQGWDVVLLGVDSDGLPSLDEVASALSVPTLVVSCMSANNETGTLMPIPEIARLAHDAGALVHADVTQSLATDRIDMHLMGLDLVSLSGHKLYGPEGTGALVATRTTQARMRALHDGGGQERGLRSGSANLSGIVGLGAAAELARAEASGLAERVASLRGKFLDALATLHGLEINGHPTKRLAGHLNFGIGGVEADTVVAGLEGVAMSAGSACHAGAPGASHVLTAMGLPPAVAASAVRVTFGRTNTEADVLRAAAALQDLVTETRLRAGFNSHRETVAAT